MYSLYTPCTLPVHYLYITCKILPVHYLYITYLNLGVGWLERACKLHIQPGILMSCTGDTAHHPSAVQLHVPSPLCSTPPILLSDMHTHTYMLTQHRYTIALFPGPTQLSVACSTVKRGEPGIFSHVSMT